MARRRPLVATSGNLGELPTGDTLAGASRVLIAGVESAEIDIDPTPITPASIGAATTGHTHPGGSTDLRSFGVHFASQSGCVGDGTDETTKLQAALAALPAGGKLVLDAAGTATYGIAAPLVVPPGRTLTAGYSSTLLYPGNAAADPAPPCTIKVLAGFVGAAAVRLLGKTAGSYTAASSIGHRLENLTIDGTAAPAAVAGVQVYGFVREARLSRVTVRKVTGNGFDCVEDPAATGEQSRYPQSLRFYECVADNVGGAGFSLVNVADTTMVDCNAQGSGWVGYNLAGIPNGILTNCRAEWSTAHGFLVTSGYWGTGQGSGGLQMVGCLTDRNGQNGVHVDAQGGHTIKLLGGAHRRDGRTSVNAGYAGVFVADATTMPVDVTAVSVAPGVGDSGEGNLSPQYALSATGTGVPVTVSSGVLHGATAVVSAGPRLIIDPAVQQAAGAIAAPTRAVISRAASRIELLSAQPWTLGDLNLAAWTAPPLTNSGAALITGMVRLTRIRVPVATPVSSIVLPIAAGGAGLTTGQNLAALYDVNFNQLAVTADQTTAWATAGEKRMTLTAPIASLAAGDYYVAVLANGTTGPTVMFTMNSVLGSIGRTATDALGLVSAGGTTAMPATATPAGAGNGLWAGLAA